MESYFMRTFYTPLFQHRIFQTTLLKQRTLCILFNCSCSLDRVLSFYKLINCHIDVKLFKRSPFTWGSDNISIATYKKLQKVYYNKNHKPGNFHCNPKKQNWPRQNLTVNPRNVCRVPK